MKTFLILDSSGKLIWTHSNENVTEDSFEGKVVDVPEGKVLVDYDAVNDEPVFKDIPASEVENLRQTVELQEIALIEIMELIMGGLE